MSFCREVSNSTNISGEKKYFIESKKKTNKWSNARARKPNIYNNKRKIIVFTHIRSLSHMFISSKTTMRLLLLSQYMSNCFPFHLILLLFSVCFMKQTRMLNKRLKRWKKGPTTTTTITIKATIPIVLKEIKNQLFIDRNNRMYGLRMTSIDLSGAISCNAFCSIKCTYSPQRVCTECENSCMI